MEFNFDDNTNKIFQGCWLLTSEDGEENGCVIGGWGGQKLWEASVFQELYGAKAESDLTKTQNS